MNIDKLPSDVTKYVFEKIDLKGILTGRRVCRRWRNEIAQIWEKVAPHSFAEMTTRGRLCHNIRANIYAHEVMCTPIEKPRLQCAIGSKVLTIGSSDIIYSFDCTTSVLKQQPFTLRDDWGSIISPSWRAHYSFSIGEQYACIEESHNFIAIVNVETLTLVFLKCDFRWTSTVWQGLLGYWSTKNHYLFWDFNTKCCKVDISPPDCKIQYAATVGDWLILSDEMFHTTVYHIPTRSLIWKNYMSGSCSIMGSQLLVHSVTNAYTFYSIETGVRGQEISHWGNAWVKSDFLFVTTPGGLSVYNQEGFIIELPTLNYVDKLLVCCRGNRLVAIGTNPHAEISVLHKLTFWDLQTRECIQEYEFPEIDYVTELNLETRKELLFLSFKFNDHHLMHIYKATTGEKLNKLKIGPDNFITHDGILFERKGKADVWNVHQFNKVNAAPVSFLGTLTKKIFDKFIVDQ